MKKALTLPPFVQDFMKTFEKNGYEIFVVGGPVRDLILSRPIDNWDFTTNATPEQIQEVFPEAKYNNDYGTVLITLPDPDGSEKKLLLEVTPYRKEGKYTDNRHPDEVVWAEKIDDDLNRRDLTINAMAYDGKQFIDLNNGQEDIQSKIIRAVGDPDKRFQEDALRMMRAVRFSAQLQFTIEDETKEAIKRNAYLIKKISGERVRDEFIKILMSNNPAEGILFLRKAGLLKEILPEVHVAFSVDQKSPNRHHEYDVGTHLVETLRHCPSKDPITRFAALIHDIGKHDTRDVDPKTGTVTFYNHEIVGAKQAYEIGLRFRLSKKQRDKLVLLVRRHMFSVGENQTDKAIRRFIRKVGKENLQDVLDIRTGDRVGSGVKETSWRTELFKKRLVEVQKKPFTVRDLKINGTDVMKELKIKPGPQIGTILEEIFEKVADGGLKNDREVLLGELRLVKKS